MKKQFCIFVTLMTMMVGVQAQERLYYFTNPADSLIGVKNKAGKVVVPATYRDFTVMDDTAAINSSIIVLMNPDMQRGNPARSYGDAYSREGKLLYHPLLYDNGCSQ
ncbi:MAG TPA: hypothetical protein VM802_05085 [Chitinophaga sp.]|uniref:hypothetical protein n=1 Tax=Chitinophaga sp. TaxID=1869181 RepID=UPI002BFF691C|nr:hypothetical protein [Chitinophaga sp.]HVI44216.1 hypothetical protein [Chitinophaga sp.]